MDLERALTLIKALADGTDPVTGEVLPGEHVCQQPELVRALAHAVKAIEQETYRERRLARARLSMPQNTGKEWTVDEDRLLMARHKAGSGIDDLAALHARTPRAISTRLEKLGLLPATSPSAPIPLRPTARNSQ